MRRVIVWDTVWQALGGESPLMWLWMPEHQNAGNWWYKMDTWHRKGNSLEKHRHCRQACGASKSRSSQVHSCFIHESNSPQKLACFRSTWSYLLGAKMPGPQPRRGPWGQSALGHSEPAVRKHAVARMQGFTYSQKHAHSDITSPPWNVLPGYPPRQAVPILSTVQVAPAALQVTLPGSCLHGEGEMPACLPSINSGDVPT